MTIYANCFYLSVLAQLSNNIFAGYLGILYIGLYLMNYQLTSELEWMCLHFNTIGFNNSGLLGLERVAFGY